MSSPDPVPLGDHVLGVGMPAPDGGGSSHTRSAMRRSTSTAPRWPRRRASKPTRSLFGLAGGGVSVGRNLGQPVSEVLPGAVRVHRRRTSARSRSTSRASPTRRRARTRGGLRQGLRVASYWTGDSAGVHRCGGRVLAVPGVAACVRDSAGTAVRDEAASVDRCRITVDQSDRHSGISEPGVLETTRVPVPPNAMVCRPEQSGPTALATVADPVAPRITVRVPDGWSSKKGTADVGLVLSGPDDMVASVTIAATLLDPAAAFTRYGDDVMARFPISTLSLLPGDFCGFSGQKLMGTWAEGSRRVARIPGPHRPHLDQHRQLSSGRPR